MLASPSCAVPRVTGVITVQSPRSGWALVRGQKRHHELRYNLMGNAYWVYVHEEDDREAEESSADLARRSIIGAVEVVGRLRVDDDVLAALGHFNDVQDRESGLINVIGRCWAFNESIEVTRRNSPIWKLPIDIEQRAYAALQQTTVRINNVQELLALQLQPRRGVTEAWPMLETPPPPGVRLLGVHGAHGSLVFVLYEPFVPNLSIDLHGYALTVQLGRQSDFVSLASAGSSSELEAEQQCRIQWHKVLLMAYSMRYDGPHSNTIGQEVCAGGTHTKQIRQGLVPRRLCDASESAVEQMSKIYSKM